MARSNNYRGGGNKQPATLDEAVALVRSYAIKLFDKGDGQAADWPLLAQLLFKAGFGVVAELPTDERMRSVLRRVEATVYDRLAGNKDDGLPSPVTLPPSTDSGMNLARVPKPKLKP